MSGNYYIKPINIASNLLVHILASMTHRYNLVKGIHVYDTFMFTCIKESVRVSTNYYIKPINIASNRLVHIADSMANHYNLVEGIHVYAYLYKGKCLCVHQLLYQAHQRC